MRGLVPSTLTEQSKVKEGYYYFSTFQSSEAPPLPMMLGPK